MINGDVIKRLLDDDVTRVDIMVWVAVAVLADKDLFSTGTHGDDDLPDI